MAIVMLVMGVTGYRQHDHRRFPYINIPVASVIWTYTGMSPQEMTDRIVTIFRTRIDHHCQRYRTHAVHNLQRRVGNPDLLSTQG
jgi:hypothetical protein